MVDGFAAEAPVGADPESGKLALSEQAVDGRGMHAEVPGELADGHDVAWRRLLHPLVGCHNPSVLVILPQG